MQSKAGTSWFSPHVVHDACSTFKMAALRKQVQRKESIVRIYQKNAFGEWLFSSDE